MQGPEVAAERVAAWLAAEGPRRLDAARARLQLLPSDLPAPAVVDTYDRLRYGLEDWPAWAVEVTELRRLSPLGIEGSREGYAAVYAARVYTWVRGDSEQSTDVLRKRHVLAVRETLLARRQLAAGTSDVAVDPLSIRESYSPSLTDDAGATIQGAYVSVDVVLREELELGDAGPDVVAVQVDTRPLPVHPATL